MVQLVDYSMSGDYQSHSTKICKLEYKKSSQILFQATKCDRCSELGLSGSGGPGMSAGSSSGGQFQSHGSLYGSGLAMGSLQNLARGGGRTQAPIGGQGGGGLGPLQGRLTPTQFGSRSMGGLGQSMSLLQSSSSSSRNPLFSRKMG